MPTVKYFLSEHGRLFVVHKSHELLGLLTWAVFYTALRRVRAGEESESAPEAEVGVGG